MNPLCPSRVAVEITSKTLIAEEPPTKEERSLTGAIRWPVVNRNLGPGRAHRLLVATLRYVVRYVPHCCGFDRPQLRMPLGAFCCPSYVHDSYTLQDARIQLQRDG